MRLGAVARAVAFVAIFARAAAPASVESGKQVYEKHCSQCHGEKGDGQGPAAPHLRPKPRDFTTGKFKIRTTPSGALPTDGDIETVIRKGMPYTSMPAWPQLGDDEVKGLVLYIKSFCATFADPAETPKPIELPKAPAMTKESVAKGQEIYTSLGCASCHGASGRGEGPSAPTLKDDKGDRIRAADLTKRWTFRGGPTREDIFRTFSTGLNGTPMPSFYDSLKPEERWALTDYIDSLGDGDTPRYSTLLVAASVDEVDASRGVELFKDAAAARFPVVGQIVEPGRAFAPAETAVQVRAVYDQQKIAFLVRWNDIRADTTGTNSPALEVPMAEEEEASAPAGESTDEAQYGGGTEDTTAEGAEFSDAVAIQIPLQPPDGVAKPYFIFGDAQKPVDLWFLDLASKRGRSFVGRGSAALTPAESSEVEGGATYEAGEWTAFFTRDLRSSSGLSFAEGAYVPIAFSLWDGTTRERGNRRGLTQWFYVHLAAREKPSVVGPMAQAAFGVLVLEVLAVYWIRRRHSAVSRATSGGRDGGALADRAY